MPPIEIEIPVDGGAMCKGADINVHPVFVRDVDGVRRRQAAEMASVWWRVVDGGHAFAALPR